ncbi:unnamed protein product [Polarella glacialis]|uniref:Inositol-pentakisphosphate 2-kinase n=1 Tax=Polarella glacialis TaxID=89957 RepID=A0A813FVL2_POLGL|nr:unnamed protein product [Polarella glacialis]
MARELHEGKRYNRDIRKLRVTFDAFAPAVRACNGVWCLVKNSQGAAPEVYESGQGEQPIYFNLEAALAWEPSNSSSRPSPSVVDLRVQDLTYIMEGNLNIVCVYNSSSEGADDWRGYALRCRKGDNSTYRVDCAFAKQVAVNILGCEYVDAGELIGLSPENVKAIDEAIFDSRGKSRQSKRLDCTVRDSSGTVLAVKLKPKCGLVEKQGLPSRYRLFQSEKMASGKIHRISSYDPVKVLSKQPKMVLESLKAAMEEPQNNIRMFLDGKMLFSEDVLAPVEDDCAAKQAIHDSIDQALLEAGLPGTDTVMTMLAGALSSPSMAMPERLKRIQCWAAGETAPLAEQLYKELQDHCGEAATHDLLTCVTSFERSVVGIADCFSDEAGIAVATRALDDLLTRVHQGPWDVSVEQEVVRLLCRFLLGRTTHDVSVLLNLVYVDPKDLTPMLEQKLQKMRFKPIELFGIGNQFRCNGIWFRTTVVDLDAKPYSKIPEYARQLEHYATAYYNRGNSTKKEKSEDKSEGEPKEEAIGGHDDSIRFEGEVVWKKDQGGQRGEAELDFLRASLEASDPKLLLVCPLAHRLRSGSVVVFLRSLGISDAGLPGNVKAPVRDG